MTQAAPCSLHGLLAFIGPATVVEGAFVCMPPHV